MPFFARVGQHAVRQLAILTFRHLHQLSLRFHLARRTGGLSRVIERGVKGIESIVRFTILNGVPTVFEFAIMAAVIWYQFGFFYVVIVAVMIVCLCLVHDQMLELADRDPPGNERERY